MLRPGAVVALALAVMGVAIVGAANAGSSAEQGRALYLAKCVACHGPQGAGDGPAARALPRKPKDMTQASFWQGTTDQQLESVIRNGKPGSAMRAFPMKPQQMASLIAYLRTFDPR